MDRALDTDLLKAERNKRWLRVGLITAAVVAVGFWGLSFLTPSVPRSRLRTAVVETGVVEASLSASGTVAPEVEEVITSPVETRLLKVLHHAGDTLKAGEAIAHLDAALSRLAFDKLRDQLALKANAQAQLQATLDGRLIKLVSQLRIKTLEMQSNKVRLEQSETLFKSNAISKNDLDQAQLTYERSVAEVREVSEEKNTAERTAKLQAEGLALEMKILSGERSEAEKELARATPASERGGILTWILSTEGATVHKGDIVAKVADLKTYRVDATVSDIHLPRLAVGMPVYVLIGDARSDAQGGSLEGTLSNILPTIENGIIKLTIALTEKSNPLLRPNLRVDVSLITARKLETLRVRKGGLSSSMGKTAVFVVRGNEAVKTVVQLGASGADYIEIVGGLSAGDEIVISDTKEFEHLKEFRITQ